MLCIFKYQLYDNIIDLIGFYIVILLICICNLIIVFLLNKDKILDFQNKVKIQGEKEEVIFFVVM